MLRIEKSCGKKRLKIQNKSDDVIKSEKKKTIPSVKPRLNGLIDNLSVERDQE